MAKHQHTNEEWDRAKKLCRLNRDSIRKAKELGFMPHSLIKNIPNKNQPWKLPVREWIDELYAKRFNNKHMKQTTIPSAEWDSLLESVPLLREFNVDELPSEEFLFDEIDDERPTENEIKDQDWGLLRRQKIFRMAASFVADHFSQFSWVTKVAMFGSVARPLEKEVPRFRKFRRRHIEVWHECKDVDVAVWVTSTTELDALRKAVAHAVNELLEVTSGAAGVAHHQVDVFILDAETNRYLGRLCHFGSCPKPQKFECDVPGCGASPFLRQHEDFTFDYHSIDPENFTILFVR
ncbi:hypothetical protein L0244_02315 [bacterium]|nr:hypothetical protein [bacterium]